MKIREIVENEIPISERQKGHVVISPDRILHNNKQLINDTLTRLAKAYDISIEDAAFALENALKRLSGTSTPTNYE